MSRLSAVALPDARDAIVIGLGENGSERAGKGPRASVGSFGSWHFPTRMATRGSGPSRKSNSSPILECTRIEMMLSLKELVQYSLEQRSEY